ncbi:dopamine receptor 1-like [Hydra vulgaris]|uniref:Dopamine receptor 1-like n=1 Tax=Hydra vulgaris TaxID=6087 RepID=A0ABM4CKZ6_HYDVU
MITNNSLLRIPLNYVSKLTPDVSTRLAVCFILISIFGIILNIILIFVILSEKKLRSITNTYIVNMAIVDLLIATTVVPFDIDFMLRGNYPYGTILCGFKEVLFLFTLPSSVLNLMLLTLERFVSVFLPFKRTRYFLRRIVLISILCSWIYTINFGLYPIYAEGPSAVRVFQKTCAVIFSFEFGIYFISVNFIFPVLIMIGLYFSLFLMAFKYTKKSKQSNSFQRNLKIAKTIFLLFINFLVFWGSFIVLAMSNMLCNGCHSREKTWIGNVINYCHIVFNPLIYGLLNESLRKAIFRKIYKPLC